MKKLRNRILSLLLVCVFLGNSICAELGTSSVFAEELSYDTIFFDDVYDSGAEDIVTEDVYDEDVVTDTDTGYWEDEMPLPPVVLTSIVPQKDGILLTWEKYEGVLYFDIYRSETLDGEFSWIGELNWQDDMTEGSFLDTNVFAGVTYYYKVRAFVGDDYWSLSWSEYSEVISAQAVVPEPVICFTEPVDHETVRIRWEAHDIASGYEIYRSLNAEDGYVLVQTRYTQELTIREETLDGANEEDDGWTWAYEYDSENNMYIRLDESQFRKVAFCEDNGLEIGIPYYYKIRAFVDTEAGRIYSKDSNIMSAIPAPGASKIKKIKLLKPSQVSLTWKKVEKAEGYYVYRAKGIDGKFKKIKTVKSSAELSVKVSGLKHGVAYYYKVQAYHKSADGILEGVYSEAKERIMDYYGYETESWESRKKRIFGKKDYGYATQAQAKKHMKTIKIKVWDISNGKKVTRVKYLTVNKKIAETVQKIFKEIYNGKEKFPIYSIGGYSWRGDNSSSEHCEGLAIDINPNENYMIDGDKILSGSFWKPGKNPYSIPTDGEVVKIMRKYGFFQGIWGDRRDYMHFSYFGT